MYSGPVFFVVALSFTVHILPLLHIPGGERVSFISYNETRLPGSEWPHPVSPLLSDIFTWEFHGHTLTQVPPSSFLHPLPPPYHPDISSHLPPSPLTPCSCFHSRSLLYPRLLPCLLPPPPPPRLLTPFLVSLSVFLLSRLPLLFFLLLLLQLFVYLLIRSPILLLLFLLS